MCEILREESRWGLSSFALDARREAPSSFTKKASRQIEFARVRQGGDSDPPFSVETTYGRAGRLLKGTPERISSAWITRETMESARAGNYDDLE
jgi:hypothetical protein